MVEFNLPKQKFMCVAAQGNKESDNVQYLTRGDGKYGDIYIHKLPSMKKLLGTSEMDGCVGMVTEQKMQQGQTKTVSLELQHTHRSAERTALQFEDDDDNGMSVGYARILKTPQKERRVRLKPRENNGGDGDGQSNADSTISVHENMAMIATVHPFKRPCANSSTDVNGRRNSGPGTVGPKDDGLRIEDVTDDPRYNKDDDDAEFEEGALVEYCHSKVVRPSAVLKQPPLVVRRPSSAIRTTQNLFGNGTFGRLLVSVP
uniref:Protein kinase domain-containing protein n=1 Tax=Globodera pallida TaxID=36090 RepID=A0A183BIU1_GLOPA